MTGTAHEPTGPYGLPVRLLARLWTLADIQRYAQIEDTKARQLMRDPAAPPRLRLGSERCDRWDALQVVAWLHGDDWRDPPGAAPAPRRGRPPGSPWNKPGAAA